jgi:hypothetical protein
MIQFSEHGSRVFTGKDKGEFEFRYQDGHDTELELKKMGIVIESEAKDVSDI